MPMKEWFRNCQPAQLYIILALTVIFFVTELIFSHLTHALTLLMDSYHTLCNILALTGCLITIKNSKENNTVKCDDKEKAATSTESVIEDKQLEKICECADKQPNETKKSVARTNQENKLRNTFGWARIEVMSMLICCIFLASLSFSVCVEALQTLAHIDHSDEMHHPLPVLFIGAAGLLLNGLCYLLIGGYTFHQGSFLYVTESGDVVLNRVVIPELVQQGGRRLSSARTGGPGLPAARERQGFREMCRDILGCVFVIICAVIVYFTEENVAKFVDPALSLVSSVSLMCLSFPYMKESCLILLQTIPASIDIEVIKKDLISHFPGIANIHDFHVWQLTTTKIISTVHIIFQNHQGYGKLMDDIKAFLMDNGITQVTIQPEFSTKAESIESLTTLCLMQCQGEGCKLNHCCPTYDDDGLKKPFKRTAVSEVITAGNSLPDLRSIKVINPELSKTTECLSTIGVFASKEDVSSESK